MKATHVLGVAVAGAAVIALLVDSSSDPEPAARAEASASPHSGGPHSGNPHSGAANPHGGSAAPRANSRSGVAGITGVVRETIAVPGYTYLRLEQSAGETWAAVPTAPDVEVGQRVTVTRPTVMKSFRSSTLNRTFDTIYFGQLGTTGAGPAASGAPPPGHPAVGSRPKAAAVPSGGVEPAKGENAARISEIFERKAALEGKTVRTRGVVVKATGGILGFTYLHLRDGTGSAEKRDNDLTVTTKAEVKAGDIISVEGTLRLNVNVGSGYEYPVLLEDAKVLTE